MAGGGVRDDVRRELDAPHKIPIKIIFDFQKTTYAIKSYRDIGILSIKNFLKGDHLHCNK